MKKHLLGYLGGSMDRIEAAKAESWREGVARALTPFGCHFFDPMTCWRHGEQGSFPLSSKIMDIERLVLPQCDFVIMNLLPGPSIGGPREIEIASRAGIPVFVAYAQNAVWLADCQQFMSLDDLIEGVRFWVGRRDVKLTWDQIVMGRVTPDDYYRSLNGDTRGKASERA